MPIGLVLLFLMGVAPVLPWRKASQELLRKRLFWPAWIGAASLVLAVMVGATGWAPLVAFGMAGFAAGAALRQLALATRRQGWRGFVGRANGGMIVHLGVIMIAVALASSNSFTHATRLQLEQGVEQEWQGHTFRLESVRENVNDAGSESALEARVLLDNSKVIVPAITTYLNMGIDVPTPGVRTGLTNDVYLTLEQGARAWRHVGVDSGVHPTDDPLAVDWRVGDGARHAAVGVPRIQTSAGNRSGVGTNSRGGHCCSGLRWRAGT